MTTQVILEQAIIAYPTLAAPKPYNGIPGSNERYTTQLIVSPNDNAKVQAAHDAAVMETFRMANPKIGKDALKICEWNPLKGLFQISTTNYPDSPPQVYNTDMTPMAPQVRNQMIFNGCKVKAAITFHGYMTGEKGVRCTTEVIQLLDNVNIVKLEIGVDPEKLGFQPQHPNAPEPTASVPGDPSTFQQQPAPTQQGFMPPANQQSAPAPAPAQQQAPGPQSFMPPGVDPNNPWGQ